MNKIADLAHWIGERDHFAILTHVHPDGDALGTSAALGMALTALGKQVACVCDDPAPAQLSFLPIHVISPEELPFHPEWALLCDAGEAGRAGRSADLLNHVRGAATLDHHGTSAGVGEVRVICPQASATGVPALDVIRALGVPLSRDMAACLYAAIATDTGNFSFGNTNAAALRAAADCLEAGLNVEDMAYRLFRARRPQKTRLIGEAIHVMELLRDGRLAVLRVTREMLEHCGAGNEDVDALVNFGMDTEGVRVAMLLEQRGEDVKMSLRSRGDVDVSAPAVRLGGGGHKNAAGATLHMPMDQAYDTAIALVMDMIEL